jgi:hypothetical protein
MPYRSKKYLNWLIKQPSQAPIEKRLGLRNCLSGCHARVYAHQRSLGGCGTSLKPPDTYALCLTVAEHEVEHSGDKTFWGQTDRARLCVENVTRYLDEQHNIDGWRLVLELLADYMDKEGL